MINDLSGYLEKRRIDLYSDYVLEDLSAIISELLPDIDVLEFVKVGANLSSRSVNIAQRYFSALVIADPSQPVFWRSLGYCEKELGNHNRGAEAFLKSNDLQQSASDLVQASICFLELLLPETAIQCAERALAIPQATVEEQGTSHYLIGRSMVLLGRFLDSRARFLEALELCPTLAPAAEYLLIAAANCADMSAVTDLIRQMDQARWLNPDLIQAVLAVFAQKSNFSSVLDVFNFCKSGYRLHAESYHLAIESSRAMGKFELAYELTEFRKREFPEFSNPSALVSEIHTLGQLARFSEKDSVIDQFNQFSGKFPRPMIALNPWLLFSFVDDPRLLRESAEAYSDEVIVSGGRRGAENFKISRSKSIKGLKGRSGNRNVVIGFFGCEFRNHPVADCLRPLLRSSGRDCDIVLFSNHFHRDSVTEELQGYVEGFVDCSKLDYESTRAAVLDSGVNLLVDLSVHTAGGRPDFFARGLAPVQVNYLGFSGTSGSSGYDYIVGDSFIIPEGQDSLYSERVLRLDYPLLSMNISSFSEKRRLDQRLALGIGDREDTLVFALLAQPYKISQSLILSIARMLRESPRIKLLVSHKSFNAVAGILTSMGVKRERLLRADFKPTRLDHLARLSACDLLLDTFPYNAHSLAADAVSAGTPVLALTGSTFASRVSGSLMNFLGLGDFVVDSLRSFEEAGCSLASRPADLFSIRELISQRVHGSDFAEQYSADFFSKCGSLVR